MGASLFCDTCGAEITAQMRQCSVCGCDIDHSSTPPGAASGAGSLLAGRYRLIDEIGQGGFGLLYKAQDTAPHNRLVAIKQINMGALSAQEKIEATDSYNREVMYLSKLQHKNLPRFYDHFTDPDHWYVVMAYIEGETLEDILKKTPGGRLPLQQVLSIGIALCDVLQYLHQQNPPIIFRDIKPGNIMMTRRGHLYLIDFGIARSYRPEKAKDTGALGSPGYAAPEQYGRAQTTAQTDLYGLGATLQTLLTGMEPLEVALDGMPADLYLPRRLRNLLARMMERDAGKRPKNAAEVKSDLRRLRGITLWNEIQIALSSIGAIAILDILAVRSSIITRGDWTVILALNLLLVVPYMAWRPYKIAKTPGGMDKQEIWLDLRKRLINAYFAAVSIALGVICFAVLPHLLPGSAMLLDLFGVGILTLIGLAIIIAICIAVCVTAIFVVGHSIELTSKAWKNLSRKISGSRPTPQPGAASPHAPAQAQVQQMQRHP
jgi:hypothetical protein